MNTRALSLFFAVFWTTALSTSVGRAAPFVLECISDAECSEGLVCSGTDCISEESVCATSDDCAPGHVCELTFSTCPIGSPDLGAGGSESAKSGRCAAPNGRCKTPCTADADCSDRELCTYEGLGGPQCAEGDETCEELPTLYCGNTVRFCGADDPFESCVLEQVCNSDERCVFPEGLDLSETVILDNEKSERLRASWHRTEGDDKNRNGIPDEMEEVDDPEPTTDDPEPTDDDDDDDDNDVSDGSSSDSGCSCNQSALGGPRGGALWLLLGLVVLTPFLRRQMSLDHR